MNWDLQKHQSAQNDLQFEYTDKLLKFDSQLAN